MIFPAADRPSQQQYNKMKITLVAIVGRKEKHRPAGDHRRKINLVIASYRGEDGYEYRKAFESYGEPTVPKAGDNSEISKLKIQY